MVAFPLAQRLKLPLAPAGGGVLGLVFAVAVLATPSASLETIVTAIGVPTILAAAQAPLGLTARLVLALVGGSGVAVATWGVLLAVLGRRAIHIPLGSFRVPTAVDLSRLRPAEPPMRAPLLATRDLGTPFLEVKAGSRPPIERALPVDLDAPLSAYDPAAIPDEPAEPVRAVPPLMRAPILCEPGERFETFELTPPPPSVVATLHPEAIVRPRTDATIQALLDRLEAGVARREPPRRMAG